MDKSLENLRYWVEPAHPMIVRLYDDLVSIYRNIKENYQKEIDASFDRASQQLGFVITTTVPVTLEVGENGDIKNLNISSERLKGTIFEKELSRSIEAMKRGMPAVPATSAGEKGAAAQKLSISPGTYNFALFWYDAIRLRLRTDWMEPAQPVYMLASELMGSTRPMYDQSETTRSSLTDLSFEHQEPAHRLDKGRLIAMERAVLIAAIDEAYPELKLGERIGMFERSTSKPSPDPWTQAMAEIGSILNRYGYQGQAVPGVKEPAHMAPGSLAGGAPSQQAMAEIGEVISRLRGLGPGIREPAHIGPAFQAQGLQSDPSRLALSEVAGVLSRYGLSGQIGPGIREPAHVGPDVFGPHPDPWRQAVSEISSVISRYGLSGRIGTDVSGPQPEPWRQAITEISDVLGRYGISRPTISGRSQPGAMVPGVREPAHMMPGQAGIPAELGRQVMSEVSGRLNQYSPYALSMPQIMGELDDVLSRFGPHPEPWRQAAMNEIAQRLSRFGNQPVPASQAISEIESTLARYMIGPGIKEPAHMGPFNPGLFR